MLFIDSQRHGVTKLLIYFGTKLKNYFLLYLKTCQALSLLPIAIKLSEFFYFLSMKIRIEDPGQKKYFEKVSILCGVGKKTFKKGIGIVF